jgi:hypothetical protein
MQTSQAKVRKMLKGLREFGGCTRTRTLDPLIKSQKVVAARDVPTLGKCDFQSALVQDRPAASLWEICEKPNADVL